MKHEVDLPTQNIANYIKEKGISVRNLSEKTNIPYSHLSNSLLRERRSRSLRAYEFLAICDFLDIDPRTFMEDPNTESEEIS